MLGTIIFALFVIFFVYPTIRDWNDPAFKRLTAEEKAKRAELKAKYKGEYVNSSNPFEREESRSWEDL